MTYPLTKLVQLFVAQIIIQLFLFGPSSTSSEAADLTKKLVDSNGHAMALWHKQAEDVASTKQIILLHGRTWSSLPDFDLQVEGEELSMMDNLMKLGFDVWALDARGYGETKRDATGWNNPDKSANDVANIVRWVTKKTGVKPVLFGWSYGSMTAQLAVQQNPDLVKAVVLFGYPIDPEEIIIPESFPTVAPREKNTAKNAASDFIVPGSISQKAIDMFVAESLKADTHRADWNQLTQWNQLDATKIKNPLLFIQGEHDPLASAESDARFFIKLPNANKQWVVLAGGDHAALLEVTKDRLVIAVNNFVEWLDK
ncbi:MAG: alpha/beta hydrolase [Gammaproteobacteria bacterium]|nr:MAG: alpha/beta hydrolase [Gammaproteobacteria bacterium]